VILKYGFATDCSILQKTKNPNDKNHWDFYISLILHHEQLSEASECV
jgi:hypothetical protein